MSLGTIVRDGSDDYPVGIDFSLVDVFGPNPVTGAIVSVIPPGLDLGAPTIASNIVSIRVSGGVEGVTYTVTIRASNAAAPPNVVERSFEVETARQ